MEQPSLRAGSSIAPQTWLFWTNGSINNAWLDWVPTELLTVLIFEPVENVPGNSDEDILSNMMPALPSPAC